MFTQLSAPDHVFACECSGKLTKEDVKEYRQKLDNFLKQHKRIGCHFDMSQLSDISADALLDGVKADLHFLGLANKVPKMAAVTDKEWPLAIINIYSKIMPSCQMKVFPTSKKKEALEWVSELPPAKSCGNKPAITLIKSNKENVIGYELDGAITREDLNLLIKETLPFVEDTDKFRYIAKIKNFEGLDPSMYLNKDLVKLKLLSLQKLERYAVVGGPDWMKKWVNFVSPAFSNIDMKVFPIEKEDEAWRYLGAEPVKTD